MPGITAFMESIQKNASRIKAYAKSMDGSNGTADCVGLIIGAMRLAGMTYSGIHGSNYFARYHTIGLHGISTASELVLGQVVYKALTKSTEGYDLPSRYAQHSDQRDYYHIGIVQSVNPLRIAHCSSGGMHYDTRLGKWAYAGFIKGVDYGMNTETQQPGIPDETGPAYVDVPNDGTVNIRAAPRNNAKIQDRIREGTTVEVVGFEGEWAKVEYKCTGYVMTKFLREEGVQDDVG